MTKFRRRTKIVERTVRWHPVEEPKSHRLHLNMSRQKLEQKREFRPFGRDFWCLREDFESSEGH